jgi:uncharacterized membrane protein YeaQ/YmgE (transglycosylase-associated protein family)
MALLGDMVSRGSALWHDLTFLQQIIVGSVGALVGYAIVSTIIRSVWHIAVAGLILIVAFASFQALLPGPFCKIPWPSPIAPVCRR